MIGPVMLRRLGSPQARFFAFKLVNLALTIVWGFEFTFVVLRVAGPRLFALLAVLNALSLSLAVAEMGISKVAFLALRATGPAAGPAFAPGLLRLYVLVCALASLVVAGVLPLTGARGAEWLLGALFFPSVVLNLVWVLVQNLALALGVYLRIEAVDAARRVVQIVALATCLAGVPLAAAIVAVGVVWLAALAAAMRVLAPHLPTVALGASLGAARRFVAGHWRQISATFLFNCAELFVYQLPVFFVPWRFGLGPAVVLSDTFFKMHRATSSAYRAATESQVPEQAAAFADGARDRLRHATATGLVLALPALAGAAIVLLGFGDRFFAALTGRAGMLPSALAAVTVAFMAANAVQAVAGSLLLNTGQLRAVRDIGGGVAVAMAVAAVASAAFGASIITFLWVYTLVYAVGAVVYGITGARLLRTQPRVVGTVR